MDPGRRSVAGPRPGGIRRGNDEAPIDTRRGRPGGGARRLQLRVCDAVARPERGVCGSLKDVAVAVADYQRLGADDSIDAYKAAAQTVGGLGGRSGGGR